MIKADWNSKEARSLYNELFYNKKPFNELSDEEQEFCKTMYHLEEFASGLDG